MAAAAVVPSRVERVAEVVIRRWCGWQLRRHALLHIEGSEHIPTRGPVMLACRHVHHLYDGCVLLTVFPRPVRLLLTLDWLPFRPVRRLMTRACEVVHWPVVSRASSRSEIAPSTKAGAAPRIPARRALRASAAVLEAGEILAVFPEGYPNIDPVYTPKQSLTDFSPFLPGFATILDIAQHTCSVPIPVIPIGFNYEPGDRWRITMRCGPAVYRDPIESREAFVTSVEAQVVRLSQSGLSSRS